MKKPMTKAIKKVAIQAPEPAKVEIVTPPKTRVNTINGLRVHICWAFSMVEKGLLDPKILNSLSIAANTISNLITDHEFEARIRKLEATKQ